MQPGNVSAIHLNKLYVSGLIRTNSKTSNLIKHTKATVLKGRLIVMVEDDNTAFGAQFPPIGTKEVQKCVRGGREKENGMGGCRISAPFEHLFAQ